MTRTLQPHACLWCGAARYAPSLEHIFPEALGCPEGFVLRQGVCDRCNNNLGHVDQALVRQFEINTVLAGIPRKKGKRPTIDAWAPLQGGHDGTGASIHLNAGPDDVKVGSRTLKPAGGATGVHSVKMSRDGDLATLSFNVDIGRDRKLLRALYKIALETIAFYEGLPSALAATYDPVRAFVRTGAGRFAALVMEDETDGGHLARPPVSGPDGLIVPLVLFGVTFLLDPNLGQPGLGRLEDRLRSEGEVGWSLIA